MYVTACKDCDALAQVADHVPAMFRCGRCDGVLQRSVPGGLEGALALYSTAALAFAIANAFPIVAIEALGNRAYTSLIGAAVALHTEHRNLVALLVLATTVVVPAVELLATIGALISARMRNGARWPPRLLRVRAALQPWSMVEIFILGTFVTITRLSGLASVLIGPGLWTLMLFMVLHSAASHAFDPAQLWKSHGARPT
jgi:paraquat-inducible protein A